MFGKGFNELSSYMRKQSCSFCNSFEAGLISKIDYWDLLSTNLVQCNKCRHMELDPKLDDSQTEKGCLAYYIREIANTNQKEQYRNLIRNFRKGVVFAYQLKFRNISPKHILEIGPGTGFFSKGVQYIFPNVEITVLDIVDQVLEDCQKNHGFLTIKAFPDNKIISTDKKFDLVIARDLIEHVNNPFQLIKNVYELLLPNGYFHFITPNGYEDAWGHYIQWKSYQTPSELLINHVNYYDGSCLRDYLREIGFKPIKYYTFQVKEFFRGKGWKYNSTWSTKSVKLKANTKENIPNDFNDFNVLKAKDILSRQFVFKNFKFLTFLYSLYHHHFIFHIKPERNVGHEIFGLFQKKK